ncbi:inositol transport system ATP-binding protein [Aequitasia blattaphilus]|uniref:Ribose/galactose/methyl galactoside import ATP-binding protein n=1 Tax=Aequitasia blattaphilus TaxID=2949332 RepID=A0ABT1EB11_9FIRM|nr:sugar ABC transporter ATP-binding protein [Aequitasia blattaphilus]MCP1103015.1 sugar ABC transporter ATP-binding protein [Aequitasia blattaphilus]MCR8615655.1 sugar ABC transporter ATP-binding protein [Aequitasia blattaphilus]
MSEILLEMKGIVKEFSGIRVLKEVPFTLKNGTVHALMGENGAGKSTLMKILNGTYLKDQGEIYIKGESVDIKNTSAAKKYGIAMIHQELSPFLDLSVASNMFMGREFLKNGTNLIDENKMNSECIKIFEGMKIEIPPKAIMRDLSVAQMQLVEIAKAVSTDAEIIIMDEPTSAITEEEVGKLFKVIDDLRNEGKGIIYISHKMDEIYQIADEITVMRDGTYVGCDSTKNLTYDQLISMMVGRSLDQQFHKTFHKPGEVLIEVKNLTRKEEFRNISFEVRSGEILGIAGLMGAGRTEIVETIFGLRKKDEGEILIEGKAVTINCPKDAIEKGVAFVSEDRKSIGLNLIGSIKENITLANLRKYCSLGTFIHMKEERETSDEYIKKLAIKTESRNKLTGELSGGNQQKVVIARWLSTNPKVMILDEPTRGIDVGAKAEIYKLMDDFAAQGNCVIMVSSEMPEILGMSDRVIVIHDGKITGSFYAKEATQEKILTAASGI